MNIDLLKIIKLVFAICDDTQIRENKTFQIARDVVNAIQPSDASHQPPVVPSGNPTAKSCNPTAAREV